MKKCHHRHGIHEPYGTCACEHGRLPFHDYVDYQFLRDIYRTLNTDRIERTQGDSYILPCTKKPRVNDLVLSFGGLDWPIDYQDMV
jgi:hypothetical protein